VLVFGSLATGGVHEASDIDLAVIGLPADRYLDALTELSRLAPCGVDLVRVEEAPASLVERIQREGIPL
jgi:predicted nucleotidyltransferase